MSQDQLAIVLFVHGPSAAADGGRPILQCSGNELLQFCVNDKQRAALQSGPGRNVSYTPGSVTPSRIVSRRQSTINSLIIQSRGVIRHVPCADCSRPRPGLAPFFTCTYLPGSWGDSCGNCKWRDHASQCHTAVEEEEEDDDEDENDHEDEDVNEDARDKEDDEDNDTKDDNGSSSSESTVFEDAQEQLVGSSARSGSGSGSRFPAGRTMMVLIG